MIDGWRCSGNRSGGNNGDYFPDSSSRDLLSRLKKSSLQHPLLIRNQNTTRRLKQREKRKKQAASKETSSGSIQRRRRWARTTFKLRKAGENPPFRRANHVFRHRRRSPLINHKTKPKPRRIRTTEEQAKEKVTSTNSSKSRIGSEQTADVSASRSGAAAPARCEP